MGAALEATREQVLGYRRHVQGLDARLPWDGRSVRRAAWAGLQDSMPRAAVLSLHARLEDTAPDAWAHPSLVQVWGPRYSAYAVPGEDHAVFTLGRLPADEAGRRRAVETADRLEAFLAGRRMPYGQAGRGLGVDPNSLRYASTTGRVLIRWEGARQPLVWTVPAPEIGADQAREELARRYLHVMGPTTAAAFARWAGVRPRQAEATFAALRAELVPVRTPLGTAWLRDRDEETLRWPPSDPAPARLLPSGDVYTLLQDDDRSLLVGEEARRRLLWTPRVWPGAVLVDGEVVGTWRRAGARVEVSTWRGLSPEQREQVGAEARSLPVPEREEELLVRWAGHG